MNIAKAEQLSGLPAKTLRYYEEIGLVIPHRRDNGYRNYTEADVHKLRFVQRARSLGFSVDNCRALLALYEDQNRASADVKRIAMGQLEVIERKLAELQSLRDTLRRLVEACAGDHRPDCPILEDLAEGGGQATRRH